MNDALWQRLQAFHAAGQIPNLLFHGPHGAGKKTLVYRLLSLIYGADREQWKEVVLIANCAHGKGIKFIREDLKFFARTNAHANSGTSFKSIVLTNADNLTVDAQSALRRCIELFSHNTRFFLVVSNQSSLMKPILSRFCDVHVPLVSMQEVAPLAAAEEAKLRRLLVQLSKSRNAAALATACQEVLHEQGYSALDILRLVRDDKLPVKDLSRKYELLMCFDTMRKEVRSEPLLMYCVLHLLFLENTECISSHIEGFCF